MAAMALSPQLGIVNGNKRTVQDSGTALPNVRDVIMGWFRPLALTKVEKTIIDYQVKETERPLTTMGVIQPFGKSRLMMKAEGERNWEWMEIHATPDLVLNRDDVIIYRNVRFRVMASANFEQYGYVEYEIVNDYKKQ